MKTDINVSFLFYVWGKILEKKKLSAGEKRKKEILDAAKRVFLRKGYVESVMEDIIAETTFSRGGVYYHYKNKIDILHDLMREGISYRMDKINEFLKDYSGKVDKDAIAQMIVDKMLDESDLMSVYAIYLQAQKNSEELKDLFPTLVEEALQAANIGAEASLKTGAEGHLKVAASHSDYGYLSTDFFIFFMNTVILGCEILDGARDSFVKNREYFVQMVKLFLDFYEKNLIK